MSKRQFSLKTLFLIILMASIAVAVCLAILPSRDDAFTPEGYLLKGTDELPPASVYWFRDANEDLICGFACFGVNRPQILVSHQQPRFSVPSLGTESFYVPRGGMLHIFSPSSTFVPTDIDIESVAGDYENYSAWGEHIADQIHENQWP